MAIKVFIDTNIYEGANFSFYNKQFSKLKELTEEESVELLYNEIIYQEVYQHIEENLTKAVSEYNKVIEGNRAFAPFRMDEKWGEKISQIKPDVMVSELRKRWDERDIIESEIIHNTIDDYDEDSFDETARYCPDCGCKMNYENDMGAFCVNCAPNH